MINNGNEIANHNMMDWPYKKYTENEKLSGPVAVRIYCSSSEDVKKKLLIEATWNQLIYDKYIKNVKVDEKNGIFQYQYKVKR